MKRIGALCLLFALFVAGWMTVSRAGSRLIGGTAERQVFVGSGSSFGCGGTDCVGSEEVMGPFSFTDLGTYDVTITASFQFRTSPGDGGQIWISMNRKPGAEPPLVPGRMWLEPSALGTSTSVTWVARGLAAGVDYPFSLGLSAGRGTHRPPFSIETSSVVVVVEATPAD